MAAELLEQVRACPADPAPPPPQLLERRLRLNAELLKRLRLLCADAPQLTRSLLPNFARPLPPGGAAPLSMLPCLSKLAFISMYEAHSAHQAVVGLRASPLQARLAAKGGKTRLLKLEAVDGAATPAHVAERAASGNPIHLQMQVLSDEYEELAAGLGGPQWLLCPTSDQGLADAMRWDDAKHVTTPRPSQPFIRPLSHVLLAELVSTPAADDGTLTLKVQCSSTFRIPRRGEVLTDAEKTNIVPRTLLQAPALLANCWPDCLLTVVVPAAARGGRRVRAAAAPCGPDHVQAHQPAQVRLEAR